MKVNSLWELREWFTVDEAAERLSNLLEERFAASDILRLALDGHLKLSVNLPAPVDADCWGEGSPEHDGAEGPPEQRKRIDGLWDLQLTGVGRLQIEADYHYHRNLPFIHVDGSVGAIVELPGVRCRLPPDTGGSYKERPSSALPAESVIVVRKVALADFAAARQPARSQTNDASETPLAARERATLLTIIAALADAAKIDLSKPSKASGAIAAMTETIGAPVAPRTIENHLKRIREALERRGK